MTDGRRPDENDRIRIALRRREPQLDGRVFRSAVTTALFCRASCRSRVPGRHALQVFRSAAEALLADKRPCPRCRPETAPEYGPRHADEPLLARALTLLVQRAPAASGIERLAASLGTDAAQLRQLFNAHLGVSPSGYVRGMKLALAYNLNGNATLSAAQIARAVGLRDQRQLPDTLCGRYDAALTAPAVPARGGVPTFALTLGYRPPYDWPQMLAFYRARAIAGVERVRDGAYERSFALDGAQGRLRVGNGTGDTLDLHVEITEARALPRVVGRVQRMFDLHVDPALIGAHLGQDTRLAPLVASRPGLRVPGAWDPFETAMRAILGQQVSVGAAVRLAGRLVEQLGAPLLAPLRRDSDLTHVFPDARRVADAGELRLGMPGARARALTTVARAAIDQPALLTPARDLAGALDQWRALPGIGDWTAHYIALRALHEPDAFPAGDVGLLRALPDADGERATPKALRAYAERWRPWRSYAAQHLWAADPGLRSPG